MTRTSIKRMVAGFAAAVCVAVTSFAADGTWTGATSTDLCVGSNWSGGEVPTGTATISVAAATTLACSGTFSPSSIVFGADSALVTISGGGCITNIVAIQNNVATNHVFNVPVTFLDAIEADIPLGVSDSIVFSGGMTAYAIKPKLEYGVTDTSNAVYAYIRGRVTLTKENDDYDSTVKGLYYLCTGATLTVKGAVNSGNVSFRLATGTTLIIDGDFVATKSSSDWSYICYQNHHSGGTIKINGKVYANNSEVRIAPYHRSNNIKKASGMFYVSGLVVSGKDKFYLNGRNNDDVTVDTDKSTAVTRWYIGRDGLSAINGPSSTERFSIPENGGGAILTAMEDFAISAKIYLAVNTSFAIDTTNPESGENHKVTVGAVISGSEPTITVSGSGEVLYTVSASHTGTMTGSMTVNDAATVSANAGIRPHKGPVNLNGTSTLKVAQSGTMPLAGLLTAASGTTLAFNFTDPATPPTISAGGGLALPESGVVNVKVTADNGNLSRGTYTIVSGAGLTDGDLVKFRLDRKLTDDMRGALSISEGNLILTVSQKPGIMISVY